MSKKYFLYLLIVLIYLSIEAEIKLLDKYSQITVYEQTYLYLSLDGIDKEDELSFKMEIIDKLSKYPYLVELYYKQASDYSEYEFENYDFEKLSILSDDRNSIHYYYHFTIKLTRNTDYLLLKTPSNFYNEVTIIHTKIKSNGIVKIIVIITIIVILIAIFIYIYLRRKKRFLIIKIFTKQNYSTTILTTQNYPTCASPQKN